MNWEALYHKQRQLDRYIEEHQGVTKGSKIEEKTLALLVELGELANETRCFKFWSTKGASEQHVILEEYVDGLHFLLSLGLDLDMRYDYETIEHSADHLMDAFLQVYSAIDDFRKGQTKEAYQILFTAFLDLGHQLGFSPQDIMNAYHEKNEVNFERQDQGY
ncbi:dUTPase [Halobacillus fulvus]|nr:dUTPase [Halobacillus fulvus]